LIDSLINVRKQQKKVITQLRDSLDLQKKQLIAAQKAKAKQKITGLQYSDVGKSLLSMDQSALAPILKKLNDNMLVGLYRDGSNMQREKLLQSLDPNRAAELLKKVTQ
jgi:Mg/Co/Ni transporter MgtE